MSTTAYTFVATVENRVGGDTPAMLGYTIERIRELLDGQGWTIVPCDWSPDADTIIDAVEADAVEVIDFNPASVEAATGFSIEDWHFLLSDCCTASLMDESDANLVCGNCGGPTQYTTRSTTPEAHAARLAATMQV